jgi:hypothetical protein
VSEHPAIVLVSLKLRQAESAFEHMCAGHAQQEMVCSTHVALYNEAVHTASLANNLQGLYTRLEALLKDVLVQLDGDVPRGEAWHKDLLAQAHATVGTRPPIISALTLGEMMKLLAFRHVVRSAYSSDLRPDLVLKNFETARVLMPAFKSDLLGFMQSFGSSG